MTGEGLLQKAKVAAVLTCRFSPSFPSSAHSPFSGFSSSSAIPHRSPSGIPTIMSSSTAATTTYEPATITSQKRSLRSKVRRDLKAFPPSLRSQEDIAIQNNVLESLWFKSSTSLCAYISSEALREVDTSRILSEILSASAIEGDTQIKKKLYVPRVEDKNSHMRMLSISSIQDLVANSMNILEPTPISADGKQREDVMLANHPVDMFLLPGVAFDRSGRRLGRGGGYYDVFLKKYQEMATERKWKQPLLVALAYSVQIMDEEAIPVTPHDVSVDAVVSPSSVIPISTAALERM